MVSKRKYECRCLALVRSCMEGFPTDEPDPDYCDRPDFVFRSQSDALGVEVTRIFHDQQVKAEYANQRYISAYSKLILYLSPKSRITPSTYWTR